ncbi:MAG TPA: ABC transporter permease, partial [Thermomicrobiales bacterium]|nr:ABC transporter permease [Thermomicrobiales bacterium]
RITRTSMLEVLRRPYVTTARAKGLRERVVIFRHAFRNGLIPVVTLLGGEIPALIGGSFIVENVFNWPGMGTLAVQSIGNRDYPVIMTLVLIASVISVVAILITDIAYTLVDPRIRYAR